MHTVDLLEQALIAAERLGYELRNEWLGGSGGGCCQFNGRKWLFIDLALTPAEQLAQVLEALRVDPLLGRCDISRELALALNLRKSA
ncbi:MAG: hypothetical protein AB7U73_08635 [Pirellulales bacterium]